MKHTSRSRGIALIAAVAVGGLVLAGCSSDSGTDDAAADTAAAETTEETTEEAAAEEPAAAEGACAPEDVFLVQSGRGLENEYYIAVDAGAQAFAQSVGLEDRYQWIASDGDSAKQQSQIEQLLAEHGACTVLNVDPNESAILPAILDAVNREGAWMTVQWNRPEGVTPLTSGKHFVAFMSEDGFVQGYETAKALFEAMGGSGNIVALQGMLDNTVAQTRFQGLQAALEEYPDITLLEDQTAKWDRTEGQNVTQALITKYGDDINGVWAANDSMGLGAAAALQAAGIQAPITGIDGLAETLELIQAGDGTTGMVATTIANAANQGGFGLAIAHAAATGQINPDTEPADHRSFYLKTNIATKANVDSVPLPDDTSGMDFSDIWAVVGGEIPE